MLNNENHFLRALLLFAILCFWIIPEGARGESGSETEAGYILNDDLQIPALDIRNKSCGTPESNAWRMNSVGTLSDSVINHVGGAFLVTIQFQLSRVVGKGLFLSLAIDSIRYKAIHPKKYGQNAQISYMALLESGNHKFSIEYIPENYEGSILIVSIHFERIESPFLYLAKSYATSVMRKFPSLQQFNLMDWRVVNLLMGFAKLYDITSEANYLQYVRSWANSHIVEEGSYDQMVNDVFPVALIIWLYQQTQDERYQNIISDAKEFLESSYPKNHNGIYFHVRDEIWDDTLPGIVRFLIRIGEKESEPSDFYKAAFQIVGHAQILQDDRTGLFYHAYDTDGSQYWADPVTHLSPEYWARGNGWIIQACADIIEFLPDTSHYRNEIIDIQEKLLTGLLATQDHTMSLWPTVLSRPASDINYFENSAACLYLYGIERLASMDLFPNEKFAWLMQTWRHLLAFVYCDDEGEWHLSNVSKGTGPGDYQNYVTIPVGEAIDDLFGAGLFLEALTEMNKLTQHSRTVEGTIHYFSNNEPVPGVSIIDKSHNTVKSISGSDGFFKINDAIEPDIVLSFEKPGEENLACILMYDAALAARFSVGLGHLTEYQKLAADVSGDGRVQMYDAGLIARYVVQMPVNARAKTGGWGFSPDSVVFGGELFSTDLQIKGYIYGDVHGDWRNTPSDQLRRNYNFSTDIHLVENKKELLYKIPIMKKDVPFFSFTSEWEYNPDLFQYIGTIFHKSEDTPYSFSNLIDHRLLKIGSFFVTGESRIDTIEILWKHQGSRAESRPKLENLYINGQKVRLFSKRLKRISESPVGPAGLFPNPFNSSIRIQYFLSNPTKAEIYVCDILGRKINLLVNDIEDSGFHWINWEGTDDFGSPVSSGIYFVRFHLGNKKYSRKILFLK